MDAKHALRAHSPSDREKNQLAATIEARKRSARAALYRALGVVPPLLGQRVNPCEYWRKRKNPGRSRARGSAFSNGGGSFALSKLSSR